MAGTMGRLSVGVTGLQTSQYALNATAHNLINTQTEGYTRQQVLLTDQSYNRVATDSYYINNVGMGVVTAQIRQVRDQFADDVRRDEVGIEIHSGKNRIVRRIFESLGYKVVKLDRVFFAGLTKKGLRRGEWRYLSEQEVNYLRMGSFE